MSLAAGVRLGAYEVIALLGSGGMGEVYRARDTRLKREVAIKILPEAFAHDAKRLARFQREAELLATLNHSNIGAVYGFEQSESTNAIVLELIEGETLADRLQRGAIPVVETLKIARQIAEALEAAHERGIIHRDLKPANIKITPDDKVKVLDFGLAKALETSPTASELTHSPTLSIMATQAGVVLGTAAYMSPEQAKGLPADHRSDVFSFGCVLYEMLTGRHPFQGDSTHEVMASVLVRDADLNAIPANLHPRMREVLQRCLEKNPKRRYQAIGDVRAELEIIAEAPAVQPLVPHYHATARPLWKRALPVIAASVLSAAAAGAAVWIWSLPAAPIVTRFPMALPENMVLVNISRQAIAIAPDGTRMVYVSDRRLYLRAMDEINARPISGTDLGSSIYNPVFSPDGQSIAFVTQNDHSLKKISITGGAAITLCAADDPFGMSWSEHGILVGQGAKGIFRVSPNGGTPEQLVTVAADEQAHGPQMMPDGDTILFTLAKGRDGSRWDTAQIVVQSMTSGTRKTLIAGGTDARYVPTGHLVYLLRGVLLAVPFDADSGTVEGGPVPIVEGVARHVAGATGAAQFSVSNGGTLIYAPGPIGSSLTQRSLAFVDRSGAFEPVKVPPAPYDTPRLSPDGRQIAVVIDDSKEANVWIADPSAKVAPRRLTFAGRSRYPIWSSDGTRVAYQSDREGDLGIFWQRADGAGPAERLTKAEAGVEHWPDSWSPDGKLMAFTAVKGNGARILLFKTDDRTTAVFAEAPSKFVSRAMFSPDGLWIAYSSDETGRLEIFVQPYPPTGIRYQVGSGRVSRGIVWWSPDGKELIFNEGPSRWLAVAVTTQPTFSYGSPRDIPRPGLGNQLGAVGPRNYDQTPDGKRMLIVLSGEPNQPGATRSEMHVVLNWFEELKQRVPIKSRAY